MKDKPILFSTSMVRALIAGEKTQTRRIMKVQPINRSHRIYTLIATSDSKDIGKAIWCDKDHNGASVPFSCPYSVGMKLWVRETYCPVYAHGDDCLYRADKYDSIFPFTGKWKPSIFMPRKYSRITLEVTGIRFERLQGITEEDCLAEGIKCCTKDDKLYKYGLESIAWTDWKYTAVDAYRALWESINGKGSWDENPYIWCYTFRRVL
jgi:hypothetical protein